MKRIYFVIAALAAVTLSSCEREKDFQNATPLGKNDIAFSLQSYATRSADAVAPQKGLTVKLDGEVCLEETIEEMDYAAPATRGVPAYTFNVGEIYKTMGVYGDSEGFGEANFERMDENMVNGGWRYWHNYGSANPWPDEKTPVDFYFSMPAAATGVSDPDYADQQITFTFDSPTSGAAQQDLLFSHTAVSKEQHDRYLPNGGAPVMMYHALTGVKFRNGHTNDGSTKTVIKSVKFKGLWSHGICTVSPNAEGTKSKDKVSWEGLDNAATFTMDFNNPAYDPKLGPEESTGEDGETITTYHPEKNPDGTVNYGSNEGDVTTFNGTSWTAAAADHNLNDEEGSMTFWFIPQEIDENVTLEVTFVVKTPDTPNGTEVTHIIKFGELVTKTTGEGEEAVTTKTEWKAGQLRTYTLKPFDVDVEIFDNMTDLTKDSLHVTNTGNVDEYVRIMVIGNWYGWKPGQARTEEPSIMVGYQYESEAAAKAAGHPEDPMVTPWFREDDTYSQGFDSTFPGGRPVASSHWKRGTGSYFYYDQVIGAGKQLSGTDALFQHYELDESYIPNIYVPVSNSTTRQLAEGVHLVMEIVVQAIPAANPNDTDPTDGVNFATCWEAWSYAIGKTIKAKP